MQTDADPTEVSFLLVEFCDDIHEEFELQAGGPDDPFPESSPPPQQPLGFSPITNIDIPPVQSTMEDLGFSPVTTCYEEHSAERIPGTTPAPTPGPANTRKRKGKAVSATPYALKRQLDDKEAKKIATAPAVTQDDIRPTVPVVKTPPPPGAPATTKRNPLTPPPPAPRPQLRAPRPHHHAPKPDHSPQPPPTSCYITKHRHSPQGGPGLMK
ncbi:hypothetical protein BDZ91DRAFT_807022 [Kalaharituber pfeilii]|nr:hypothetical protein BDZ91DRAFT_807022 [Kalaharituber pfeilii]